MKSSVPLLDGSVDDGLVQAFPFFDNAFVELVYISHLLFAHSLLHEAPDFIIDGVQIWAIGRHRSGGMKSGVLRARSSTVS